MTTTQGTREATHHVQATVMMASLFNHMDLSTSTIFYNLTSQSNFSLVSNTTVATELQK